MFRLVALSLSATSIGFSGCELCVNADKGRLEIGAAYEIVRDAKSQNGTGIFDPSMRSAGASRGTRAYG